MRSRLLSRVEKPDRVSLAISLHRCVRRCCSSVSGDNECRWKETVGCQGTLERDALLRCAMRDPAHLASAFLDLGCRMRSA